MGFYVRPSSRALDFADDTKSNSRAVSEKRLDIVYWLILKVDAQRRS
jgi:hypothetical protein